MQVPVSEAKARLTDLVRRAEAGEEIVLTRHGKPVVRLASARDEAEAIDWDARLREVEDISKEAAAKALPGPSAARAADFLYDEFGLPK
ncbi:type II toxin-antitoxin system Phd/YefM family antitoxin [Anianabacter salinae]|uniref:type II toxin-antitoxin system Phd/YefM family antitoxin n=1 Tax=Anianabacter salinae TaxID=2851023 RepID=UPI00225DD95B|nr:type II toxin-antitoxin system prevent-host-death family antitoxin [Anianabacter salinae]MBV0911649.1 type II toxin-antitoxin system prevent-host-death family antitoxin [Anianabacter salinae]